MIISYIQKKLIITPFPISNNSELQKHLDLKKLDAQERSERSSRRNTNYRSDSAESSNSSINIRKTIHTRRKSNSSEDSSLDSYSNRNSRRQSYEKEENRSRERRSAKDRLYGSGSGSKKDRSLDPRAYRERSPYEEVEKREDARDRLLRKRKYREREDSRSRSRSRGRDRETSRRSSNKDREDPKPRRDGKRQIVNWLKLDNISKDLDKDLEKDSDKLAKRAAKFGKIRSRENSERDNNDKRERNGNTSRLSDNSRPYSRTDSASAMKNEKYDRYQSSSEDDASDDDDQRRNGNSRSREISSRRPYKSGDSDSESEKGTDDFSSDDSIELDASKISGRSDEGRREFLGWLNFLA